MMKMSDLKDKSLEQLEADLVGLLKTQFSLRMQHATGQLSQISVLQRVGRDIARVRTKLAEKGVGNE